MVKKRLKSELLLYTILQILSLTLFEKTPLNQLLEDLSHKNSDDISSKQLYLFDLWPDSSEFAFKPGPFPNTQKEEKWTSNFNLHNL